MEKIARFEKVSFEQWCKDNRLSEEVLKETYESIVLPHRKTVGSAGYDFILPFDVEIPPYGSEKFVTGIKCNIEEGYVLELYPRSSLGFKYRLSLNNTVGIIDSDYYNNESNEGHIMCKLHNPLDHTITLKKGESFMQGIFKKFYLAEEDDVLSKRVGGVGSTN